MLLSREEMTFDFGGARLDPERDKEALGWMMNQFLYGEITGIQIGHWLYHAPDLESARFLARQAVEEFQHVDNFLRILALLKVSPGRAHPLLRFLATGMMGDSWAEHVALEMATGEGFVLMAFYALIDTMNCLPAVEILRRAVKQEERHVAFGEEQTSRLIAHHPALRRRLLGLNLVWRWAIRRLVRHMERRLPRESPVLMQLPAFLGQALQAHELRLQRIGLVSVPLRALPAWAGPLFVLEAYGAKALAAVGRLVALPLRLIPGLGRPRRLTETYLADPALQILVTPQPPSTSP